MSDSVVSYRGALVCKSALPRYVDNGDGTVTDNATGLMWEKKSAAGTGDVHDVSNLYAWSSSQTAADGSLFTIFLATLNGGDYYSPSAGLDVSSNPGGCLANRCDWRVPTIVELQAIVEVTVSGCGSSSPCIDPAFGPTEIGGYWSSSSLASGPINAWLVNFHDGSVFNSSGFGKSFGFAARAVRSGR